MERIRMTCKFPPRPINNDLRHCPGTSGIYASKNGEIFSINYRCNRTNNGALYLCGGSINSRGYVVLSIIVAGKRVKRPVHRLVLEAWVGPRPPGMECRHLDGSKLNNSLENLRWGTSSENKRDSLMHGTSNIGEKNGQSKLTWAAVKEIRRQLSFAKHPDQKTLALEYGISKAAMSCVVNNKTWKERCAA